MTSGPSAPRLWSLSRELEPRDDLRWLELADVASFVLAPRAEGAASITLGLGEAARLGASGEGRFAALGEAHRALVGRAACDGPVGPTACLVAAFEHTLGDAPTAHLVLPELTVVQRDGRAYLVVCGRSREPARADMERALAAGLARLEACATPRPARAPRAHTELRLVDDAESRAALERAVDEALSHIARGALEKVVLSRSVRVPLETAPSHAALARALVESAPGSTLYLATWGEALVLGATPELLVRVREGEPGEGEVLVESEAVAGSAREAPGRDVEGALLASEKDAREHESVVGFVAEALARVCGDVTLGRRGVRAAGPVRHLVTPITARGALGTSVLSLAAALHPTPALAGAPRDAALSLLAALERAPRGLYGGLVGELDARGHGSLYVAIRGVELSKGEARLRAGAGVVRASTPARELDETTAKLSTALDALRGALGACAPTTGAPTVGAQTVGAQTVGAPTVGAQTVGAPTVGAQTVGAPAIDAPLVGARAVGAATSGAATMGTTSVGATNGAPPARLP